MNLDNEDLVERLKKGDAEALGQIYASFYRELYAYLFELSHDRVFVEDTLQDIFLKLWNSRTTLEIDRSLKAYLYQMAHHRIVDKYRKRSREQEVLMEYRHTAIMRTITQSEKDKEAKLERIKACIEKLPLRCKAVFKESKFSGMKYREIAQDLEMSLKTVEGHISKAYKLIRDCVQRS